MSFEASLLKLVEDVVLDSRDYAFYFVCDSLDRLISMTRWHVMTVMVLSVDVSKALSPFLFTSCPLNALLLASHGLFVCTSLLLASNV